MSVENITVQGLLDLAEFIYLVIDTSERVVLINRKGCEIFGYTESEMVGKNYFENFLPKEIAKDTRKTLTKRVKEGKAITTTNVNPILTKTGEERIIAWQNTFWTDEKGLVSGVLSAGFDVTDYRKLESESKEREDMLSSIIHNSPYGFVAFKGESNIIITNPALEKMLGYTHEELKEKTMIDVTHPEDKDKTVKIYDKAVSRKQQISVHEKRYLRKNGSVMDARVTTWGTYDNEGTLVYNFGSIEDITETKKTQEELHISEERFRTIFENAYDGFTLLDVEGNIIDVNESNARRYGYEKSEVIGKNIFDINPYENPNFIETAFEKIRKEKHASFHTIGKRKDKTLFDMELTASLIKLGSREVVFTVNRDISQKLEAEKALNVSESKYSSLIETMNDGFTITSMNQEFEYVNGKLCEFLGYSSEELVGEKLINFLAKESHDTYKKQILKRQKGGQDQYELNWLRKDGKVVNSIISPKPLIGEQGDFQGSFAIVTDITSRKKIEEEIRTERDKSQKYLDIANVILLAIDNDMCVSLMNRKGCEVLNTKQEEIIGKNWIENFVPERMREDVQEVFTSLIKGDIVSPEYYENPILTKDREERVIGWYNTVLHDDDGSIIGTLSSGTDITEKKESEQKLEQSENLYRTIYEVIGTALLITDENDNYKLVNSKCEELYSMSREEIIGTNWRDFVTKDEIKRVSEIRNQRKINPETILSTYETKIIDKNGNIKSVIVNAQQIPGTNDTIASLMDITELKKAEKELEDSEKLLNSTFNNTFSLQGILDPEGRIIRVNQTVLDYAGADGTNLIGKKFWETYLWSHSKEEKEKFRMLIVDAIQGKASKKIITIINTEQEIKYVLSSVRPIFDDNQNIIFILAEGQDITEQILAEKSVRESEIRFRSIFDHSNDGYILLSSEGEIQDINPKILKMFGYTEEDLLVSNLSILYPTDKLDEYKERLKEAEEKGFTYYKTSLKRKDDTIFPTEINAVKINILGEEIIFGIVRDITENVAAEYRIKSSEVLYRALFENTGTGVMLIEEDNTMSLVNRTLLEMTGYNKEESIGYKWSDFIPENERKRIFDIINTWVERGDPILNLETVYINKTKEERNILISIGRIPESTQRIVSLLDITMEKKLEKIMIESEERLRSLVENVPIAIAIMSNKGELLEVNQAHWKQFGYSTMEDFLETEPTDHWINLKERDRLYSILEKRENVRNFETKLRRRDGSVFWGSISAINHRDISGDLISYQIVKDITTQKEIENELRQQIMRYKLEEANLYMVEEEFAYTSTEIFDDLLRIGYEGIIFSRTIESRWKEDIKNKFSYFKLAEKGRGKIIPPNLEKIEEIIEELPSRHIILLDRLDYLIQKNGFESTLFFIYRLMDIAFLSNHIILLSIDTSTLNSQEKNLLGKELKHIEEKDERLVPEDQFEVLMMVYQNNVSGAKPTISDIIDELQISRPTARKRIQGLIDDGFVTETTKGRSKVLQITLKGKSMF